MANLRYEIVTPSPIPNVTVKRVFVEGVHKIYQIVPNGGYVLHDKARDSTELNPDTREETTRLGYTTTYATCGANYAFTERNIEVNGETLTAYGDREFVAVLKTN